jgi:hypothetical protein
MPFVIEKIGFLTTAAATFSNFVAYSTANICSVDLAGVRTVQLREVFVEFLPYQSLLSGSAMNSQPISVNLAWTSIDGVALPMTVTKSLSTTDPVKLSFQLPMNSNEFRDNTDTGALLNIGAFARANTVAIAQTIYFNIRAVFDVVSDYPTII